jgi:hypothetical protein
MMSPPASPAGIWFVALVLDEKFPVTWNFRATEGISDAPLSRVAIVKGMVRRRRDRSGIVLWDDAYWIGSSPVLPSACSRSTSMCPR